MNMVLEGLKPEKVFYYFEEISKIPRGSGNEKQVSDYLLNLSNEKGWEVIQDEALNIIIKKLASVGYENAPTVMLQGHMDMVCEKNEGVQHDFEKDPIKLRIKDECIYAVNTTLGADNGIAVAYALAVLDSDIEHPALEVLITTDEEKGMTGAEKVDGSIFKSKYLLNMDSEEEGSFTSGCAGGAEIVFKIPVDRQENLKKSYKLCVKGLFGGHSGADIHLERANANKIIGRILYDLADDIDLISINGGSKPNAIPRESCALICAENIENVKNKIKNWDSILKNEFAFTDSGVNVFLVDTDDKAYPLKKEIFNKITSLINLIHNGVLSKSTEIDLVISSNNMGIITTGDDYILINNHPRSSVMSLLTHDFIPQMKLIGDLLNVECEIGHFYPGWEYVKNSPLRDLCIDTYSKMYGKQPLVGAIHAGLECGLLMEKIKGLDAISFGPDTWDVHTPNEHISIKSIENTFYLLCEILRNIK